jgi:TRAP-type C4-dicarboxylate transport system permease small subunit
MSAQKMIALVLLVGGILGVVYGGFSYTKETHTADLGPLHISVAEKERVNVPMWAGVGAIVIGGLLLVVSGKR